MSEKSKVLWGVRAIAEHLGVGRPKIYRLLEYGLPAQKVDGTWCAHTENIDRYFAERTARGGKVQKNK